MATFPEITSLDYNLHCHSNQITQNVVFALEFPFWHMSNFNFYLPRKFDFIYLDAPTNHYAVLHSDLASSYWVSLKMKGRYILSTAHNWNGSTATELLPISVLDEKLQENSPCVRPSLWLWVNLCGTTRCQIGMIPPLFPLLHQLTYNFLLLPEVIKGWIEAWQERSRWLLNLDLQSEGKNSLLTWFFLEMACCSTWCLLLPRQSGIWWKCVWLQFWLTGRRVPFWRNSRTSTWVQITSDILLYNSYFIRLCCTCLPCLSWRQRVQKNARLVPCQSWPGWIRVQQETTHPMATFLIPAPWASKYACSWWGGIIV